ncbi:MAG: hypothetical protein KGJ96_14485 [Xanthomonadaceae bacterium]|jgi:hypothetical protein|nr:hypothetical protein [Xanthomonadaceae bacterium]
MKFHRSFILSAAVAVALAACGNQPEAPHSTSTSAAQASSANANAPTDSSHINAPIPRDEISTRLELVGQPSYNKGDDSLNVKIRVSNQGKVGLVSAGTAMVRLGAMLMGPNGPDKAPGNRNFKRIDLPMIAPGSSAEVQVTLPSADLVGLPVRFDLVQEGVNWFSAYGQPTLDIGPYNRCAGQDKSLCDDKGQPVSGQ